MEKPGSVGLREQHPPDGRLAAVHALALGFIPFKGQVPDGHLGLVLDGLLTVTFATPVAVGKAALTLEQLGELIPRIDREGGFLTALQGPIVEFLLDAFQLNGHDGRQVREPDRLLVAVVA